MFCYLARIVPNSLVLMPAQQHSVMLNNRTVDWFTLALSFKCTCFLAWPLSGVQVLRVCQSVTNCTSSVSFVEYEGESHPHYQCVHQVCRHRGRWHSGHRVHGLCPVEGQYIRGVCNAFTLMSVCSQKYCIRYIRLVVFDCQLLCVHLYRKPSCMNMASEESHF